MTLGTLPPRVNLKMALSSVISPSMSSLLSLLLLLSQVMIASPKVDQVNFFSEVVFTMKETNCVRIPS